VNAPIADLIARRQTVAEELARLDGEIALAMTQNGHGPGAVLMVAEAAKRLRCSEDSIYRKHRRLKLGYIDPLDRKWKITERELDEYLARQRHYNNAFEWNVPVAAAPGACVCTTIWQRVRRAVESRDRHVEELVVRLPFCHN
jgi:excisionase family DNA binding protein